VYTKLCSSCNEYLSTDLFYTSKNTKDGLRGKCKSCTNSDNNQWYRDNSESVKARTNKYKSDRRELARKKGREYYVRNKDRYLVNAYKRDERTRRATPPWLSKEHKAEMQTFYWLARDLRAVSGEVYHVDHIVPIQGENVCGLNVPWNLQLLPSDLNISKSNKHEE